MFCDREFFIRACKYETFNDHLYHTVALHNKTIFLNYAYTIFLNFTICALHYKTLHSGGVAEYRSSEGKAVILPYKGPVANTVSDILGGIRSTCTYVGARCEILRFSYTTVCTAVCFVLFCVVTL